MKRLVQIKVSKEIAQEMKRLFPGLPYGKAAEDSIMSYKKLKRMEEILKIK